MLVFRRQQGESFRVGDDVEVRILHLSRSQVKIGVIAPREIEIFRTELAVLNRQAVVSDWADPAVRRRLENTLGGLKPVRRETPHED